MKTEMWATFKPQIICKCGFVMMQTADNQYVCLNTDCTHYKKDFEVVSGLTVELKEKFG